MENSTSNPDSVKECYDPRVFRHVQTVTTRGGCPLPFNSRLVYSWLVFKIRDGVSVTNNDVVRGTGLDKGTVSRALKPLLECGLVEKVKGGHRAVEPTGETAAWFVVHKKDGEWWTKLGNYKTLLRRHDCPLSPMDAAVYCLLVSLTKDNSTQHTIAGLAAMLGRGVDRKTVRSAFARLLEVGLLCKTDFRPALVEPRPEHLEYWQRVSDRTEKPKATAKKPKGAEDANEVYRSLLKTLSASDYFLAPFDAGEPERIFRMMGGHHDLMRGAGYSLSDIRSVWQAVLSTDKFRRKPDDLFTFMAGFKSYFGDLDNDHKRKGKGGSSVRLLMWTIDKLHAPTEEYAPVET